MQLFLFDNNSTFHFYETLISFFYKILMFKNYFRFIGIGRQKDTREIQGIYFTFAN